MIDPREILSIPYREVPVDVKLARVVLRPANDVGWDPVESTRYMAIYSSETEGVPSIGELEIDYDYANRRARLHIWLVGDYPRHGIGSSIYRAVPHTPLPCGSSFTVNDFRLFTDYPSSAGNHMWEKLEREGYAVRLGEQHYEMLPDAPPPEPMFIQPYPSAESSVQRI